MEYEILEENNSSNLADLVNVKIQDGWQPLGGVSVIWRDNPLTGDIEWNYAQAMVKGNK